MKGLRTLSKSLALAGIFIFVMGTLATSLLIDNQGQINGHFNIKTSYTIPAPPDQDTIYYKSAFESVKQVVENGEKIVRGVITEGSVLLSNKNNALPITNTNGKPKVSLFSASSVGLVTGGGGSGSQGEDGLQTDNLKAGMESAGFVVNPGLWNWYKANTAFDNSTARKNLNHNSYGRKNPGSGAGTMFFSVKESPWDVIDATAKANSEYGDAAIFVLSRNGNENQDLSRNGERTDQREAVKEFTDGNYLALTKQEISVLEGLKAEKGKGTFKKIIMVINSAYPIQMDFFDNDKIDLDAILWVGAVGTNGAYGIGDLLSGKVAPSGRLSDTWYHHYLDNPAHFNFGDYVYTNTPNARVNSGKRDYVVYQEGVYVGYRYTETRYEDVVLGTTNVENSNNTFDYSQKVVYPFGYGLSYTTFSYSDYAVTYNKNTDEFEASIKVTNTGSVAGKEVVQFYLQKPYTQYDKENKIEKPSIELVNYGKTEVLEPNASEIIAIKVPRREFASYDAYGAKTYVVDAGDYYLTAGKDAHDAINNILALKKAKGITIQEDRMTASGNQAMAKVLETVNALDTVVYSKADATGESITNQFENADLKRYQHHVVDPDNPDYAPYSADDEENANFEYLSRNNWVDTFPESHVKLKRTTRIEADDEFVRNRDIKKDDEAYPTYGPEKKDDAKTVKLIEMKGLDYNDSKWQGFLDQLTFKETSNLISNGLRRTYILAEVGKPQTVDHNGSNGLTQAFTIGAKEGAGLANRLDDPDKNKKPVIYPSTGTMASSFNKDFVNYIGRQWGEDCLWAGSSGLYGPSMNIHRSAYNGRNFEYWSEDPLLSGKAVSELVQGMYTRGVYSYLKHAILNDMETNRHGGNSWANEQTIREIYLRPFQIAIEEGKAQGVMTGFNMIGARWTSSQGYVQNVLRNEFGMKGIAVTDFYKRNDYPYMVLIHGTLNGNDLPDGDEGTDLYEQYSPSVGGYGRVGWAMRESAHRIMYTVVNSSAMNFYSVDTKLYTVIPQWIKVVEVVETLLPFALVLGIVSFAGIVVLDVLKYRQEALQEG